MKMARARFFASFRMTGREVFFRSLFGPARRGGLSMTNTLFQ
jgi:hypothetical protein